MSKDIQKAPHRLTIRLTDEQRTQLTNLIPWGVQDKMFNAMIDDMICVMQKASRQGQLKMLARALISKSLMLSEVGPNWLDIQKEAGLLPEDDISGLPKTENTISKPKP